MAKSEKKPKALPALPHVGQLLKAEMKKNGYTWASLGRALGSSTRVANVYQRRASLQNAKLWQICHALHHNFFADIAAALPDTYSCNAPQTTADKDALLAEKDLEIMRLTGERDLLKGILEGRG